MSILIRGMEMPTGDNNITLFLYPGGKAVVCGMLGPLDHYEAVELPPHGRLIDADALKDTMDYYIREAGWSDEINEALTWVRDEFIDHEPTIIPEEN